jgi:hypothetical protein
MHTCSVVVRSWSTDSAEPQTRGSHGDAASDAEASPLRPRHALLRASHGLTARQAGVIEAVVQIV